MDWWRRRRDHVRQLRLLRAALRQIHKHSQNRFGWDPHPDMAPTEVSFGLSPSYGIHTVREAHAWFLGRLGSLRLPMSSVPHSEKTFEIPSLSPDILAVKNGAP